jgi:hypothetical protein
VEKTPLLLSASHGVASGEDVGDGKKKERTISDG